MKRNIAAATAVMVAIIVMVVALVATCTTPVQAEGTREREGFATPGSAIMSGVGAALDDLDAVRIAGEQLVIDHPSRKAIKVKIKANARVAVGRTGEFPLSELSVSVRKTNDGWRVDETWVAYVSR
jgi:hypothetical protein